MVYKKLVNGVKRSLARIFKRLISKEISQIISRQNDILAAQWLAPLSNAYMPWTSSAMNPSGLVTVLNDITICSRQCIVECGGGISTFYIAQLLKELGRGHLYTIDHNKEWTDFLKKKVQAEGLESFVTIIFAPLVPTELSFDGSDWYSPQPIDNALAGKKVDALIVDGPLAYKKEIMYSRYPAVPYLKKYFADDYTVILDDADRAGEQAILENWQSVLDIKFEVRLTTGNIAIGKSKSTFHT